MHTLTSFVDCQYFVNTLFFKCSLWRWINRVIQHFPNRPPYISSAKFLTIAGVGGVPHMNNRWICPGRKFSWLALSAWRCSVIASGFEMVSLCTVSSMLYGPPHAFLQLSYNLEPLVISNPQARPQSDQCCSWYCRLKMTGLFLVGCASRDDRRYKDVKWCKKCKKSILPALISRFGWLCVIIYPKIAIKFSYIQIYTRHSSHS